MLIIDRFEGDFAIVETSDGLVNIPKADLPYGVEEGDVLTIVIDSSAATARKEKIDKMMNSLFKD